MKSPPSKKKTKAMQSSESLSEDEYISHAGVISRADVNKENYLDFTAKDVTCAVNSVKIDFDEVAAQNLIRYFHYTLKDGSLFDSVSLKPKERAFIDYVEHAFARMVEKGKSLNVAFGLTPGKGEHQRESTTARDVIAAAYVILLMRKNWRYEDAKGMAANFLFPDGNGDSAVEKAYADRKEVFLLMPDTTLFNLLPDDCPAIKLCNT